MEFDRVANIVEKERIAVSFSSNVSKGFFLEAYITVPYLREPSLIEFNEYFL